MSGVILKNTEILEAINNQRLFIEPFNENYLLAHQFSYPLHCQLVRYYSEESGKWLTDNSLVEPFTFRSQQTAMVISSEVFGFLDSQLVGLFVPSTALTESFMSIAGNALNLSHGMTPKPVEFLLTNHAPVERKLTQADVIGHILFIDFLTSPSLSTRPYNEGSYSLPDWILKLSETALTDEAKEMIARGKLPDDFFE